MQADGMNDNLSGNPAMPPPTGTTVQDREGITDRHPSARPAAGMGITDSHPCALIAAGTKSQAATPLPSPQQERESQQPPVCPPAAGMEITTATRLPSPQQEWKSQAATPLPSRSRNGNNKQEPFCLLPKTTDIARQLSRLPWRYFCLYKGLSLISTDRTPHQSAWRHERG